MKLLLSFCVLSVIISSCKKDNTLNGIDFRCGDFESTDCFNSNWVPDMHPSHAIVGNSYNGTNCLQLVTDSNIKGQSLYTYMTGFDSTKVYRVTLFMRYKTASSPRGHTVNLNFDPSPYYSYFQIVRQESPSPTVESEWKKYTILFQPKTNEPEKFTLSAFDIDSTWVDDIEINSF